MQDLWDDNTNSILLKLPRTPGHFCCVTLAGPQLQECLDILMGPRKLEGGCCQSFQMAFQRLELKPLQPSLFFLVG